MLKDKRLPLEEAILNTFQQTLATTLSTRKLWNQNPYKVYLSMIKKPLTEQEKDYPETQSVFLESSDIRKRILVTFSLRRVQSMSLRLHKGASESINEGQSDKEVENEFLTISQRLISKMETYVAILIFLTWLSPLNQMIKELESSLIENNETLQSVYDAKQGVWGIVKYDDSVSTISNQFQVLKRGVSIPFEKGDEYKIAYYNPETQESAPDQEVFKKLERKAQP